MPGLPDRLHLLGLPVFRTVDELAALVRIDDRRLKILIIHPEQFYRTYRIPKQSGGWRNIHSPSKELKALQAWILRGILDKLSISPHAIAYVKGRRLIDNVNPHVSNRYFLSVDIHDFFHSIHPIRVRRLFETIGYPKLSSYMMTRLCSYFSGLAQGAVTSPSLSNLICLRLDRRLAGLASRRNVVFTRYSDDITFSTNNRNALPRLLSLVREIIEDEGFELNDGKTRILGPRTRCVITGLVKNSSFPEFGIGKKKKSMMRSIMHNFIAHGTSHVDYPNEMSIRGWLQYLRNVDQKSYEQMIRYWTALEEKYTPTT